MPPDSALQPSYRWPRLSLAQLQALIALCDAVPLAGADTKLLIGTAQAALVDALNSPPDQVPLPP